jgi:PAS domain S-box-containing protein
LKLQDRPLRTDAKAFFPWIFLQARRGDLVVISDVDELSEEAGRDREMLFGEGFRSMVAVPLATGDQWFGLLLCGMSSTDRNWTEVEVEAFRLAGDVFANALGRIRSGQALAKSELRVSLAVSSTEAELWSLHTAAGELELGPKGRTLLGLEGDELCDCESFLGRVHPEDVESVRLALEKARATGVEVTSEYRVVVSGGKPRWLSSRWHSLGTRHDAPGQLLAVSVEITQRKEAEEQLRRCSAEIRELKERLKSESDYLRSDVKLNERHTDVVGQSRAIRKVLQQVE